MLPLTTGQLIWLALLTPGAPLLALLLAGLAWVLRGKRGKDRRAEAVGWATRLLSGLSLLCSVVLAAGKPDLFPRAFRFAGLPFYLDALSVYFLLLVNLVAFFASWYTVQFLAFDSTQSEAGAARHHEPELFHFFFNAFHLTMLIVPMVDNLVVLWIAIELTTLVSTLLVRYRRSRSTLEAAWKYIIITTAGIVFALFGTLLLTDAIKPETCAKMATLLGKGAQQCEQIDGGDLLRWSLLAQPDVARTLDSQMMSLVFLFVLVGYGAKAGLAPLHTWLPDGHGEAPSPVSALLSGVLLKSALYAILRVDTLTNLSRGDTTFTSGILLITGLGSMVLATPFILRRNKFKRVLAYHSLEHMGIIVFGIGIGGPVALFGALLHALNHALTKALLFLTFQNVRDRYATARVSGLEEERIVGVMKAMPMTGSLVLFGGLGLVGSPPFNVFLSEFIILWAAFDRFRQAKAGLAAPSGAVSPYFLPAAIYAVAIVVFLLTVTLIFAGLVGHVSRLLLGNSGSGKLSESLADLLPLLLLAAVIVAFGLFIPNTPINFSTLLGHSVCLLQNGVGAVCLP